MKNRIIITAIFTLLITITNFANVNAATTLTPTTKTTPTPTGGVNALEQQINNLKDRIASRVAQLKLVDKRGIIGQVTDVTDTQITLTDVQGSVRIIDVDELTKFSSPDSKSSFGISDIKKGTTIGVIGLYNKESRHLLARWVDVLSNPMVLSGAILSINKTDFTFSFVTAENVQWTIDIENLTKTNSYTKDAGVVKSGFSKLQEGQRVLVVGFPDKTDAKKIIASRIIVFPNLPPNPKIALVKQEDIAPVTPSTGSGKKITPLSH